MRSNCQKIKKFIYRYSNPLFVEIKDFDSYFNSLDKDCRREWRKAKGLRVKKISRITPRLLKDILSIYQSKPTRQNREINYKYAILGGGEADIHQGWPRKYPKSHCKLHYFDFYGCFDKSRLVAFLELLHSKKLTTVYSTMGHADYFGRGVMRYLFIETIRQSKPKYFHYGNADGHASLLIFLNDLKINQTNPYLLYEVSDLWLAN